MATLRQKIGEQCLAALAEGKAVDAETLEQLRKLLGDGKKPNAEDFVKIFTVAGNGDVK
jgi:hypothetical protein